MNFSATTEYALRIVSFMVMDEQKIYTTSDIFENLHIPFRYLRKLMINLSKGDIIDSIRGKNGGYKIAKSPREITLLQVIEATGENPITNVCFFGYKECSLTDRCIMHDKWTKIRENIGLLLSTTTLEEIKESGNQNFITNMSLDKLSSTT